MRLRRRPAPGDRAGNPGAAIRPRPTARTALAPLLFLAFGLTALQPARAAEPAPVVVVRDDRGGYLVERIREVRALRRSGREVRILGDYCYSTCTMLLGLPEACVSPATTFGFHGPSKHGRPLPRAKFEQASRVIAAHYPPALRRWYMAEARHEIAGIREVSGATLVKMGIPAC